VLLLLLDLLDSEVLAFLPVYKAARALVDLGALEAEGIVLLGENLRIKYTKVLS
jgi:hypothetical protein